MSFNHFDSKGQDKGIAITETLLLFKEGGKNGTYRREA